MSWFKHDHNKALIGQLLVKQNLISEEQLARAIELQRTTGQRLGDIFAEWNLVTQQHVQDALRRQRHLRLAAAIVTALVAPLETCAAAAVPAVAVTAPVVLRSDSGQASGDGAPAVGAAALAAPPAAATPGGLKPMTEEEMSATSAQGLHDELVQQVQKQMKENGVEVLGDMAKVLNPVLGFLDSDVTMKNVVYDPSRTTATLAKDGTLTLALPTSIGEISFANIRVRGSEGPSFGSITIKGIDLTGTVISLAFRK